MAGGAQGEKNLGDIIGDRPWLLRGRKRNCGSRGKAGQELFAIIAEKSVLASLCPGSVRPSPCLQGTRGESWSGAHVLRPFRPTGVTVRVAGGGYPY